MAKKIRSQKSNATLQITTPERERQTKNQEETVKISENKKGKNDLKASILH